MDEQTTAESGFTAPTPETLDALLPDYSVSEQVGQGGMGAVYRGVQTKLDREVAIKILPKTFGADLHFAVRFEAEAKAMAKLAHNNIVGVYDYGETTDGEWLYFCMEFIEGTDLHVLIHKNEMPLAHKLNFLGQICDALSYAHTNDVVHRDIKPENILINNAGMVKVADFGLVKIESSDEESAMELGTPDYTAPEVYDPAAPIDHRADIFALGVMTYQILTGKLPSSDAPLASSVGVDVRFDVLIAKAMAPDPNGRFQSAAEMKEALRVIIQTPQPEKGSVSPATKTSQKKIITARPKKKASKPTISKLSSKEPSKGPTVSKAANLEGTRAIPIGSASTVQPTVIKTASAKPAASPLKKKISTSAPKRPIPQVPVKRSNPATTIVLVVLALIVIAGLIIAVVNQKNAPPKPKAPKSEGPFRPSLD